MSSNKTCDFAVYFCNLQEVGWEEFAPCFVSAVKTGLFTEERIQEFSRYISYSDGIKLVNILTSLKGKVHLPILGMRDAPDTSTQLNLLNTALGKVLAEPTMIRAKAAGVYRNCHLSIRSLRINQTGLAGNEPLEVEVEVLHTYVRDEGIATSDFLKQLERFEKDV